jgi:uncharacterized protein YraI
MSNIDKIWEAYYKGQAALENDDVLSIGIHNVFAHMMAAMIPGADSDEEIAFEKGYHGEDLEVCEECEHVEENCECTNPEAGDSDGRDSADRTRGGEDANYDGGEDSSSYASGGGGSGSGSGGGGGSYYGGGSSTSGGSGPIGCGCLGIIVLAVIGGIYYMYYQGEKIFQQHQAERNQPRGENRRTVRLEDGTEVINKDSNGIGGIRYVNVKVLNVRSGPGTNYKIVRKAYMGEKILVYGQPEMVNGEQWSVSIGDNPSTRGWVSLKHLSENQYSSSNYPESSPVPSITYEPSKTQETRVLQSDLSPQTDSPTVPVDDYNSAENRRRRAEAQKREEEARANDPKLKLEAIERERQRQQELQKTFDRLMKKQPPTNKQ